MARANLAQKEEHEMAKSRDKGSKDKKVKKPKKPKEKKV